MPAVYRRKAYGGLSGVPPRLTLPICSSQQARQPCQNSDHYQRAEKGIQKAQSSRTLRGHLFK